MTALLTYFDTPDAVEDGDALTIDDIRALGRVLRAAIGAGIPVAHVELDPGLVVARIDCPEGREHLAHRLGLTRRVVSGRTERFTDADATTVLAGPIDDDDHDSTLAALLADEADRRNGTDREDHLL